MKPEEQKEVDYSPPGLAKPPVNDPPVKSFGEGVSEFIRNLKSTSLWNPRLFGIILGIVLVVGVWAFMSSQSRQGASALWSNLIQQNTVEELSEFAKLNPGTNAAKIARMEKARLLYGQQGIALLNSPNSTQRALGATNLTKAKEEFLELAEQFDNDMTLKLRCLQLAAQAELTLAGIPAEGKSDEYQGSPDKVVELLKQIASILGDDNPISVESLKQAEDVEKSVADIRLIGRSREDMFKLPSTDPGFVEPKDLGTPGDPSFPSLPIAPGEGAIPSPVPPPDGTIPTPPASVIPGGDTPPKADPSTRQQDRKSVV